MTTRLIGSARSRAAVALVTTACGLSLLFGTSLAGAAPSPAPKDPIQRIVYGPTTPANAPGQELTLQRITIAPGAKLPQHFHEGTQVATVRAGVLTYNVVSGTVQVTRVDGSTTSVTGPRVIRVRTGDALVETQSLVHYGANTGKQPVILEIAALIHAGAPLATPVGDDDAGTTAVHMETTLTSQSSTPHQVGAAAEKIYGWNLLTGVTMVDDQPVGIEMLASVNYVSGNGQFSGFITFTYADGSTLGASMQGSALLDPATGDTAFAATLGVIGGTGTHATTSGSGMFTGTRRSALGGAVTATFDLGIALT
jgi:hypothetical protein